MVVEAIDLQNFLTMDEAAALAKLSKKTLQNAVSRGELRTFGSGRRRRVRPCDIFRYLTQGGVYEAQTKQESQRWNSEEENLTETTRTEEDGQPSGTSAADAIGNEPTIKRRLTWRGSSQKKR